MIDFFQIISAKITTFVVVVIVAIISILPGDTSHVNKPADTSTATSSATVSASPSPSVSITPTIAPKVQNKVETKSTTEQVTNEPSTKRIATDQKTQRPKVDSAIGIEQCLTYAKEQRKEEERKVNEEYAQSEPKIVELAASQNNYQTETTALKYGLITQKDVVRSADRFLEVVNQGYPQETAQSIATSAYNSYSAYLRSLHGWAVNELSKWNNISRDKFDTYENQVYQACLSTL